MSVGGCTRAWASARTLLSMPVVMRILLWSLTKLISSKIRSVRWPVRAEMNRMGA